MNLSRDIVFCLLVICVAAQAQAGTIITTVDPGIGQTLVSSGLSQPIGLDFNASGDLFVAVNSGVARLSFDGLGNLMVLNPTFGTTPAGVIGWLAVDSSGNILVTDARTVSSDKVFRIGPGGGASSVFASVNNPTEISMTPAPSGNLYISKRMNGQVIETDDVSSAILKTITTGGTPTGLAFDSAGNLYVARRDNGAILKITDPMGSASISTLTTVPTSTILLGLTYDPFRGDLLGFNNQSGLISRIDLTTGAISAFATVSSGIAGHQLGDMAIDGNGDYLLTTPQNGEVWRLSSPAVVPLPAASAMGLALLGAIATLARLRRRR